MGGKQVGFITCASLLFVLGGPGQAPAAHPIPLFTLCGLAALVALESVLLADRPPWWVDQAIRLLPRRLGIPASESRLPPAGSAFDENDARIVREIWSRVRAALDHPDADGVDPRPAHHQHPDQAVSL